MRENKNIRLKALNEYKESRHQSSAAFCSETACYFLVNVFSRETAQVTEHLQSISANLCLAAIGLIYDCYDANAE